MTQLLYLLIQNDLSLWYAADSLCQWVLASNMIVNEGKTKEFFFVNFGTKYKFQAFGLVAIYRGILVLKNSRQVYALYFLFNTHWSWYL
jgi:hypothetical protein